MKFKSELDLIEKVRVYINYYPGAERLNPNLHDIILEKARGYNFGAVMTSWNQGFFIKEFKIISDYVIKIIKQNDTCRPPSPPWELELQDLWGQYYKKGDYQISHHHNPLHWSFCYYVNTPKKSSPLVFTNSNKKIFPKSGMIVLFPGYLKHHVQKHRGDGIRSIIGGNLFYNHKNIDQTIMNNSNIDQIQSR